MRFVGTVLMLLGISMIYYFGFKGLTPTQMVCHLETFFGFKLSQVDCSKPDTKTTSSDVVPPVTQQPPTSTLL